MRRSNTRIRSEGAGVYGNFLATADPADVDALYSAEAMARLRRIKRAWDPDNIFRRNHNVRPA